MKASPIFAAALLLPGCGDAPQAASPHQAEAAKPATASVCSPPRLDFRAASHLGPKEQALFAKNFRVAFDKACGEKLFADEPLIDERSADKSTLFVLNAPEANVTSIYFHFDGQPPHTILESPFGEPPQIPSVDDFHEAIYCAVRGATPEEQETTGRCLPD